METTATRKYELFLVFQPTLTDKEVRKALDAVRDLATRHGSIIHEQIWGRRDLYYKIEGHEKGVYAVLCFEFEPAMLADLRAELGLHTVLLRYNLRTLPEGYVPPVRAPREEAETVAEDAPSPAPRKPRATKAVEAPAPVPSEAAPLAEVEAPVAVEAEADAATEDTGTRKKTKHKDLDEGLNKILSDLGSV